MRNKSLSIKHNSGTFVRNTRKSVPALLDKELKFLHNLPILVSLYDKQGDINEVRQDCGNIDLKLNELGQEVLSNVPVEEFVGTLSSDPLNRLKVEVYRSLLAHYDKYGSFESEEDMNDFDIDDRDDLDFGLTEYEYYANVVKKFDEEVKGSAGGSCNRVHNNSNDSDIVEVDKVSSEVKEEKKINFIII